MQQCLGESLLRFVSSAHYRTLLHRRLRQQDCLQDCRPHYQLSDDPRGLDLLDLRMCHRG